MPQDMMPAPAQTSRPPAATPAGASPGRPRARTLLLLLTAAALLLWGRVWWVRPARPAAAAPPVTAPTLRGLQAACVRRPEDAAAFVALGTRLDLLGADRLAYGAFARAASLAPQDAAAQIGWARLTGRMQSPREAVAILDPFVRAFPSEAEAHLALAGWYQKAPVRRRAYAEAAEAARLRPADPAAPREMATAAIALGSYPQAAVALGRVLALDPSDWHSALDLGFVLDNLNRHAEALGWDRQAARSAPGEAEPLRVYAQALLQQADAAPSLQEAAQCLQAAVRLDPANVLTHVLLAQVAARGEDWPGALAQLAAAERLPPASSEVQALQTYLTARACGHLGLAGRMRLAQRRHAALLAYQARKSLRFDFIVAHSTEIAPRLALARDCAAHGDFAEAAAAYRRLLAAAPGGAAGAELAALLEQHPAPAAPPAAGTDLPVSVRVQDAATLAADRQYAAASQAYLRALALAPNSAPVLLGAGLCLKGQGKTDLAFAFLDRAFGQGAQDPPLELTVAAAFEANGFHDAARVRLERLLAHDPGRAPAWHLLGDVCSQSARFSRESRAGYARAAQLAPRNAGYLLDLADADAEAGGPDAEAEYRRAAALAPTDADALSRLAGFLVAHGTDRQAAAEADALLARALAAQPGNEFAWYQRGLLALNAGRAGEAVTALRRCVALDPAVAQSWYALSRALQRAGASRAAAEAFARSKRLQQAYAERTHLEEQVHLSPGDAARRLRLARAYAAAGEDARAIAEYEACLRQGPALAPARQELAALQARLRAAGRLPSSLVFRYMLAQQNAG